MKTKRIVGPLDERKKLTRCQSCAKRRIKCQGGSPCEYCIRTNKPCQPQAVSAHGLKFVSFKGPQQAFQVAELPMQVSEDAESTYLNTFSLFLRRCEFTPEFSNLGSDLLPLVKTCSPLGEAAIAIGALEVSRFPSARVPDEGLSPYHFALTSYGKSIQKLQNCLRSSHMLQSQGVLWCTLFLGLFELMTEVSGDQFAKHMLYGTSRILQLSGQASSFSQLSNLFFEAFRLLEGNRAILYGEDTFLSQQLWQGQPHYLEVASSEPLREIFDFLIKIASFSKRFFDRIESTPENQRLTHPEIDLLVAEAYILQHQLGAWQNQFNNSINASGSYGKLALANYHALELFLCRNFIFYDIWEKRDIPMLTSTEINLHVTNVLIYCHAVLQHSSIAGILTIFPLRMAGANTTDILKKKEIIRLLDLVSQKGFVVSERIKVDLRELWEYQCLIGKA